MIVLGLGKLVDNVLSVLIIFVWKVGFFIFFIDCILRSGSGFLLWEI